MHADVVPEELPVSQAGVRGLVPLTAAQSFPPPDRLWSDEDWVLIRRGHKSADMDDRWHAVVEGQRLSLYRSWTGHGIYAAEFSPVAGGWRISSALVEGDRDIYRRGSDAFETALLEELINRILLSIN